MSEIDHKDEGVKVRSRLQNALLTLATALTLSSMILGCELGRDPLEVRVIADLEFASYQAAGERRSLQLDLYQITQEPPEGWPVLIYIYGGGWEENSRKTCPGDLLSRYGYTVACVSYRYSTQAIFPAQIYDVKAAVRWLRANATTYHLNPDKFGAIGGSAGGHLSALLGTSAGVSELEGSDLGNSNYSSAVQAVVDWFGPTDFSQVPLAFEGTPTAAEFEALKNRPWAHLTRVMNQLVGGPIADHPDLVALANPITFITADDPPFWILHGVKDSVVPISQSEILVEALKAKGVPVEFHPDKDRGHDIQGENQEAIDPDILTQTMVFFDHYLK